MFSINLKIAIVWLDCLKSAIFFVAQGKASAHGAGDYRFESYQGHGLFICAGGLRCNKKHVFLLAYIFCLKRLVVASWI